MNRADHILSSLNVNPDVYIMVSDNIMHEVWGREWLASFMNCARKSGVTIVSRQVYDYLLHSKNYILEEVSLVVLDNLREPYLFSRSCVPVRPIKYFSKSGTSLSLAVQIVALLNATRIFLYGCDLGWHSTGKKSHFDPNHYFSSYQARIPSGFIQNHRMLLIHSYLKFLCENYSIKVINASPGTLIPYYPVHGFPPDYKLLLPAKKYLGVRQIFSLLIASYDESLSLIKRNCISCLKYFKSRF